MTNEETTETTIIPAGEACDVCEDADAVAVYDNQYVCEDCLRKTLESEDEDDEEVDE